MLQTVKELSKIELRYRDMFKVLFHSCHNINIKEHVDILNASDIQVEVVDYPDHAYMPKIHNAVSRNIKYSMKIDEDIFMNRYAFAYLIDTLDVLDNDKNLLLTPTLSTGIPSLEMFIDDVFTSSEKEDIYNIFNNVHMFGFLGANYEVLNLGMDRWDPNSFYRAVKQKVHHHFKGIHPLRISYQAQKKMVDVIKTKKNKILDRQNYHIEPMPVTYICNSVFAIRTDTWQKIISNQSLYKDAFDEVPINSYKDIHDLNICFIRNANALHPGYNTIVELHNLCDEQHAMLNEWGI